MEPRIETLTEKKLVGKHMRMSLFNDKTTELWHSFMTKRNTITNSVTTDLISMQVYAADFNFKDFTPETEFEKWAVTEVADFDNIPEGMEAYTLKGGLYAVFFHKGPVTAFKKTFNFIFASWLPGSEYEFDNREHFELLGDKYKNNSPDSEEEIWISIKRKEQK